MRSGKSIRETVKVFDENGKTIGTTVVERPLSRTQFKRLAPFHEHRGRWPKRRKVERKTFWGRILDRADVNATVLDRMKAKKTDWAKQDAERKFPRPEDATVWGKAKRWMAGLFGKKG